MQFPNQNSSPAAQPVAEEVASQSSVGATVSSATPSFTDRRHRENEQTPGVERRQFSDARKSDRPEVDELAKAIDEYKIKHRRRFITFEEIYDVLVSLGYHK